MQEGGVERGETIAVAHGPILPDARDAHKPEHKVAHNFLHSVEVCV
jgi:hypothetical protein